jgi:hypothetical protein
MKEATIHVVNGRPEDIHFDGKEGVEIEAFFLCTQRRGRQEGHFLAFGNSSHLGQMIYNFYLHSLKEDAGEIGHVLEEVAKDILEVAETARGRRWIPAIDAPDKVM